MKKQRVVLFSGGVGSWRAAKRVAHKHGTDNLVLLFTDTKMEDKDLYRFLREAAADVGGHLVHIAEGRDPWQVFFDQRFLGNSLVDPCSRILKRETGMRWLRANCDPKHTVLYLGIDWTEEHRYTAAKERFAAEGWRVEAPLCQAPFLSKEQIFADLVAANINVPRLYRLGFDHNNCGGFCIKAGQAHYALLLKVMPQRYMRHERKEQRIRKMLGKNVAILEDRRGGVRRPMTLQEFRKRLQKGGGFDKFDVGGCGCFTGAVA